MIAQIKLRRDTAANWTTRNPVLAVGEEGLETDTGKKKKGDGTTAWNTLPYKPLLESKAIGFEVSGGTTSKTLTVSENADSKDITTSEGKAFADAGGAAAGANITEKIVGLAGTAGLPKAFYTSLLNTDNDLIPTVSNAWRYLTSTFSGWGGAIGAAQNFNAVTFKIRNRASNTGPITSIRVDIYSGTGTLVMSRLIDTFNIAPGEEPTIVFPLGQTIANAEGAQMWAGFKCNQYIDVWGGNAAFALNNPTYRYTYYATEKNMSSGVWNAISSPTTNTVKPVIYATLQEPISLPTQDFLDAIPEPQPTEEYTAAFTTGEKHSDIQDGLPVASPAWGFITSTFSGWGGAIGAPQNFDTIVFKVRNRASNANPITSIRAGVSVFNKAGSVLADKTITGLNIAPGAEQLVYFQFDAPIANASAQQLWAGFACNRYIDVWYGESPYTLDGTTYGITAYSTDGNLVSLGTMQNVVSPGKIKPVLYVCTTSPILRPTQDFIDFFPTPTPQIEPVRVVLPDKYRCVVGDTFQLFYRGVVEAPYPYIYDIRVAYDGPNGKNYPRYLQIAPVPGDEGTYTLEITVQTQSGIVLGTGSTTIEIVAVASSPATPINILCIGDSLTSGGVWVQEAARRLKGSGGSPAGLGLSNINFIGTVKAGDIGWEGYGGWTWASYLAAPSETTADMWVYCTHDKTSEDQHSIWLDANSHEWQLETIEATRLKFTRYDGHTYAMPVGSGTLSHSANATHTANINFTSTAVAGGNPFWNTETDQVDFASYCTRNGFSGIDLVYTLLTWNGNAPYRSAIADHSTHVNNAKSLIDKIHSAFPNAKIKVMGIQLPSLNGGMGANYGADGDSYSEVYGNVRTVFGLNLAYQDLANNALYSDFVEFVNVSGQFDSENNMPESSVAVNTRSSKTEYRGTNGVHPATEGYYQIGDAAYRDMVKSLV